MKTFDEFRRELKKAEDLRQAQIMIRACEENNRSLKERIEKVETFIKQAEDRSDKKRASVMLNDLKTRLEIGVQGLKHANRELDELINSSKLDTFNYKHS